MSLDVRKCMQQDELYPKARECVEKSKTMDDTLPSYEFLYSLKNEIPPELYAYYFRRLLQYNTGNVSTDLRLKMFEGVRKEDIMYEDELEALKNFGSQITIYRGTDVNEDVPGLSWTIFEHVAISAPFNEGRVFKATIPTEDVLLYLAHNEDEGEIIANVKANYEIIVGDSL